MVESTIVMKFGGSAMGEIERFGSLAELILRRLKQYDRVIIVVSAMGKQTDELMELAQMVHPNPPKRELDMLVTAGERVSMALLAMALHFRGIDAISFTGSQSGIITSEEHTDAQILEVRPYRIEEALLEKKVVIVAGFQGVSRKKEITTLGRGGSDTSAVALAVALHAQKVEFYKDVPGIGRDDPKTNPDTKIYAELSHDEAIEMAIKGSKVLHKRCIELAKQHGLTLEIRSFYDPETLGTRVHALRLAHV